MKQETLAPGELGPIASRLGEIGVENSDARFAEWARLHGARLCFTVAALTRELEDAKDDYLRRHKEATDRYEAMVVAIDLIRALKPEQACFKLEQAILSTADADRG